VKAVTLKN